MRFLYQFPDVVGPDGDMLATGSVTEVARAVESAGFDGFALTDHPAPSLKWLTAGGHQTIDPFVGLAAAAAVTERITLLTYLSVAAYRNPFLLAKAATTVDLISGGRFVLGLGAGYQKSEFKALGVDFERRNEALDEALAVLPRVWSGEPVAHTGLGFEARDVVGRPRPTRRTIPIWIGGNAKISMRRAAAVQGWMPMLSDETVSTTTRTVHIGDVDTLANRIAELRSIAGDGFSSLEILVTYPDHSIVRIDHEIERHRDTIGRLVEAGITWLNLTGPSSSLAQTSDTLRYLAATYL